MEHSFHFRGKKCCKMYHVHVKLIKANKCLFILRSLRKEGYSQAELDQLFSSIVLPSITYGLPVYGASEAELTAISVF